MSRVASIYEALGQWERFEVEPAQVRIREQVFTDPDWLYAYACRLMAAADKLRKAQR